MTSQAEFWVAVAFVIFVALLIYYGVPGLIGRTLDARADAIRKELDEARKLREDAQALLADYQRKSSKAAAEADAILESARREAEALTAETKKSLSDMLTRRGKLAQEKISRAEAQAVADVRAAAVDAAISASGKIIGARTSGDAATRLLDQSIRELKTKLN